MYEVALSFAGEQRGYVESVARALQSRGIAVFYDEFEKIALRVQLQLGALRGPILDVDSLIAVWDVDSIAERDPSVVSKCPAVPRLDVGGGAGLGLCAWLLAAPSASLGAERASRHRLLRDRALLKKANSSLLAIGGCVWITHRPSHISKMVLPTVHVGPL